MSMSERYKRIAEVFIDIPAGEHYANLYGGQQSTTQDVIQFRAAVWRMAEEILDATDRAGGQRKRLVGAREMNDMMRIALESPHVVWFNFYMAQYYRIDRSEFRRIWARACCMMVMVGGVPIEPEDLADGDKVGV